MSEAHTGTKGWHGGGVALWIRGGMESWRSVDWVHGLLHVLRLPWGFLSRFKSRYVGSNAVFQLRAAHGAPSSGTNERQGI